MLIKSGNNRIDRSKRKFTSFLKAVVVDFDKRDAYPEGNVVEVGHDKNRAESVASQLSPRRIRGVATR